MNNLTKDNQILLIIDAAPLDQNLVDYFRQYNFNVKQTTSLCIDGLHSVAAIIIDWDLIKIESTIAHELFRQCSIPVIIISNTRNEEMCVRLLEAGADDFLIKPIVPRELHARISAINRRMQQTISITNPEKEVLKFANWHIYPASRQLFNGQNERFVSKNEFDLLLTFARHPQQILDREFLSHVTNSSVRSPLDRRIDGQISRLRQKIELDYKKPALIKTIRNNGYLFTPRVLSTKM